MAAERRALDRHVAERTRARQRVLEEEKGLEVAKAASLVHLEAQQVFQAVAQAVQQKTHKQIGRVVSKCLSAVFEDQYELRILFERKRGKTEAVFTYLKNGRRIYPEVDSGGVMDLTSMALRLCSLVLGLPPADKVVGLDEPMRMVDAKNLPKVGLLIETLAKEMGVQFIIVTHDIALEIGKVIKVDM